MKKVRYIAGLAGLAPAAAAVMTGTAAHAAPAGGSAGHDAPGAAKTVSLHPVTGPAVSPDLAYSCFSFHTSTGTYGHCNAPVINATSGNPAPFTASGLIYDTYNGDRMKISCYYTGTSVGGDKYYDHIVREDSLSRREGPFYLIGHMPDYYINFNGKTPNQLLRHC